MLVTQLKTDYNTNFGDIENEILDHYYDKYVNTQEFNNFIAETFDAMKKQANLATKAYIDDFVKR